MDIKLFALGVSVKKEAHYRCREIRRNQKKNNYVLAFFKLLLTPPNHPPNYIFLAHTVVIIQSQLHLAIKTHICKKIMGTKTTATQSQASIWEDPLFDPFSIKTKGSTSNFGYLPLFEKNFIFAYFYSSKTRSNAQLKFSSSLIQITQIWTN